MAPEGIAVFLKNALLFESMHAQIFDCLIWMVNLFLSSLSFFSNNTLYFIILEHFFKWTWKGGQPHFMFFHHTVVVKTQLCVVHVLSTNKIAPIEFVTFLEMDRFLTNHSLEFQEIF